MEKSTVLETLATIVADHVDPDDDSAQLMREIQQRFEAALEQGWIDEPVPEVEKLHEIKRGVFVRLSKINGIVVEHLNEIVDVQKGQLVRPELTTVSVTVDGYTSQVMTMPGHGLFATDACHNMAAAINEIVATGEGMLPDHPDEKQNH